MRQFGIGQRRACRLVLLRRSTFNYRATKKDTSGLRGRLRELAEARRRYGYRRLTVILQRDGWAVNHKGDYALHRRGSE
jgi:putative transposase